MESHGPHKQGVCLFHSPHISSVKAQLGTDTRQVFGNAHESTFMRASVHMHDWVHAHVGALM